MRTKQGPPPGYRTALFPPVVEKEKGDPAANVKPKTDTLVCFKGSEKNYDHELTSSVVLVQFKITSSCRTLALESVAIWGWPTTQRPSF